MGRKKKKPKRQKRRPNQKRRIAGTPEWVGGRLYAPAYITEDEPYRPEIILWLELPDELVVGSELVDPNGPPMSFAATLLDAMAAPMVGRPRRPARIRVADAQLAAQVQEAIPDIDVVVAPTPELHRFVQSMMASMSPEGDSNLSYFEGGRISAETVGSLFQAANLLYDLSPWQKAHESQVVRLDIPGLDVEGACVSIIGAQGETFGFIIFPSLLAYERFLDVGVAGLPEEGLFDLGTPTLSLIFERGADLPSSMRREATRQGWPVAGPKAYPWVQHRDRDGLLMPLTEKDVLIVSACATSLATFFLKHGGIFEREDFDFICESYVDENDLEVRFTAPYEAGPLFEVNDPPSARLLNTRKVKVGRNAPCPCGSGKKYKKCCLGKRDTAEKGSMAPAALHEMDQRLVEEMIGFAARRFGDARLKVTNDFDDPEAATQLLIPWSVYHFLIQGKPVVRWFAEEESDRLSKTEIQWIEAQQASWLGLWEVTNVEPGSHLTAMDLLTGEERTVQEIMGSKTLVKRDVILGRIVDFGEVSVLCGLHPHPLPPAEGAQVVRRVRGRLRRKRAVPVDRLHDEKIGRYMIARWEETVLDLKQRRSIPPMLRNTDGDELLLTVDYFEFDAALGNEIRSQLANLEDAEPPLDDDPDQSYLFIRTGQDLERTIVGRAVVLDGKIRLETNSVNRADRLRERIEAVCRNLIRHRIREHSDPSVGLGDHDEGFDEEKNSLRIPSPEAGKILREYKEKHYTDWTDSSLPALEGRTPREAVRTKEGKSQVDLLLKECENHEARLPKDEQFDFSIIRKELGL